MTIKQPRTPDEAFGQNVATARGWRALSQRELAERLSARGFKVDAPAVSRIEKGSRAVRLSEAMIIADVLDFELAMLVAGLDRSPAAELKSARRGAQAAYEALRGPLVEFAQTYMWVHGELESHPELVAHIRVDDDTIESPDEYYGWSARRIEQLEIEAIRSGNRDPDSDFAAYRSEVARRGIGVVLDAYLEAVMIGPDELERARDAYLAPRYKREQEDGASADPAE